MTSTDRFKWLLLWLMSLGVFAIGAQPIAPMMNNNYLQAFGGGGGNSINGGGGVGMERIMPSIYSPISPGGMNFPPPQQQPFAPTAMTMGYQDLFRQQLMLQQQQRGVSMSPFSSNIVPTIPPPSANIHRVPASSSFHQFSMISPVNQQYPLNSLSYVGGAHPYSSAIINGRTAGVGSPPPEIPMEIVVGHQMPNDNSHQRHRSLAMGAPLITESDENGGGGAASVERTASVLSSFQHASPDQQLLAGGGESSTAPVSSLPKFLQGESVPQDAIDAYKRIIRTPNSNYEQQVKRIEEQVVQRLDADHQSLYREFMRENDEREQQHRERIHKTVGRMSHAAQEQFAKISAILRNPSVPDSERWSRVVALYSKLDPELRDEFEREFKGFDVLSSVA